MGYIDKNTGLYVPGSVGGGGGSATGSMNFYKCASVDTSAKTWSGYKAVLTDGVYSFEDTVTEGLSYDNGVTPTVDVIYSADATVVVSALYKKADPITLNDTNCLIFIDGSSLSNQALAPNKQEVTFGNGVSFADGYIVCPNNSSGRITTKARNDGFGGSLTTWTWDYYFISDASYLDCSGHSDRNYAPTLEGSPGESLFWRSQNSEGKRLGVPFEQNQLICLSMQWDAGELHIWNKGKYIGVTTPSFNDNSGTTLGINCDGWDGNYDRMADKIKLFRFSNIARYTPGVDFELPEEPEQSDGLVFYAPLSEAKDTAETGQALTVTGTIAYGEVDGIPCATFNGSNYITFPDTGLPDGANARTIHCRMRINSLSTYSNPMIFGYGKRETHVGGQFSGIFIESDKSVNFSGQGAGNNLDSPSDAVQIGKWHSITVTKDGSDEKIYVDGALVQSGTTSKNTVLNSGVVADTTDSDSYRFDGSLAELRIYNRALTDSEITELANEFNTDTENQTQAKTYVYTVSGAGMESVNGNYYDSGLTASNRPVYTNGNVYLGVNPNSSVWTFTADPTFNNASLEYYGHMSSYDDPTASEYMTFAGTDPAPTVTVYSGNGDSGDAEEYVYTVSGFMPRESSGTFEGSYYVISRPADASSEIPTTHKIYKNASGGYMVCCSTRWSGWCLTNSITGELGSVAYAQGTSDLTEPPTSSEKTWYNTFDNSLLTVEKSLASGGSVATPVFKVTGATRNPEINGDYYVVTPASVDATWDTSKPIYSNGAVYFAYTSNYWNGWTVIADVSLGVEDNAGNFLQIDYCMGGGSDPWDTAVGNGGYSNNSLEFTLY